MSLFPLFPRGILVPADNAEEAAVVEGLEVYPSRTLRQAADFLCGTVALRPCAVDVTRVFGELQAHEADFADVKGQGAGQTGAQSP